MGSSTAIVASGFSCSWCNVASRPTRRANTSSCVCAYLLIFWCRSDDIVHQDGHQFSHSMNSGCEGPVRSGAVNGLSLNLGLVQPFASYIVYDVEYSKFVSGRCFLEMGE